MAPRTYPATVRAVHDGDSCTVELDLGLGVTYRAVLRVFGMNARELAMPGGPEARDHLAGLLPAGSGCVVTVIGPDKYGARFDARIATVPGGADVTDRMVADGYGARWLGQGPKPVPPWPLPAAA